MSEKWRLAHRDALFAREWDGDLVVYDDCSGDTHLLEGVAAAVFDLLAEGPTSDEELIASLLAVSGESQASLEPAIGEVLSRFGTNGLVERVSE